MTINYLKNIAVSDTGFMFDPATGNTFTLNETALYIVNLLKEDKTKEQIISQIAEEYEVSVEQIERDMSDLLIQLKELGLVK
ncbi:MAG: HPr-rel-A system PqqD family peptide chaperone [Leptospiraceae bacterium]|nr:HPr-rel-A system PqqD family peptide chaperone [Leptospiraceae bacterium]MCP5493762.1 HPr-rel-A system PqqD family peptide chaperone [Leptospiraceae bacterium]